MPEIGEERISSGEPIRNLAGSRPEMSECPDKEYIPHRSELLRNHEISIRFLSVGCVIRVGCKEIPFQRIEDAMSDLNDYVKDPYQSTKRWNKIFNKND